MFGPCFVLQYFMLIGSLGERDLVACLLISYDC